MSNAEVMKYCIDGACLSTTIAALLNYMPAAAAFVSLVWGLIRIYETKTVQKWLRK